MSARNCHYLTSQAVSCYWSDQQYLKTISHVSFIVLDTTIFYIPCAVPDCYDIQSRRHQFPHPIKQKRCYSDWLQLISNSKLVGLKPFEVYQNYRVCDVHFAANDKLTNLSLKDGALPTVKLPRVNVLGRNNWTDIFFIFIQFNVFYYIYL